MKSVRYVKPLRKRNVFVNAYTVLRETVRMRFAVENGRTTTLVFGFETVVRSPMYKSLRK
jgi:hypothetical protein